MFSTGAVSFVTKEMRKYNLDILGVSESRWNGSGKIKLATGETVLYSGNAENETHNKGTALILSEKAGKSLRDWEHGTS